MFLARSERLLSTQSGHFRNLISVEMIKRHYYYGDNIQIADRLTQMIKKRSNKKPGIEEKTKPQNQGRLT